VEHSQGAAQIVVIDNGSSDESIMWCQQAFPSVEIIALNENLGFAGGYNAGLAQSMLKITSSSTAMCA
jgi:GT2 family glycosyltransferase